MPDSPPCPAPAQLTLDALRQRLEEFGGRMQDDFHLPDEALDPLYANENWLLNEQPDAKRTEQIVTLLELLGYLGDRADQPLEQAAIDAALVQWENDYLAARAQEALAIRFDAAEEAKLAAMPWAQQRQRYLKAVATFEGEVALTRLPADGEVSLASRVLHLRLRVYGLSRVRDAGHTFDDDVVAVGDGFGEASRMALRAGGRIFWGDAHRDPLEVANLLGHAPAATDAFIANNEAWPGLYRGRDDGARASVGAYRIVKYADRTPRWIRDGWFWTFDAHSAGTDRLPEFVNAGAGDDLPDAVLAEQLQHPNNVVGLELLQLRLWMMGYYLGELDGDWGPASADALDRFVAENSDMRAFFRPGTGSGHLAADILYRRGRDGWTLLNLGRVLTVIVDQLDVLAEETSTAAIDELATSTVESIRSDSDWQEVDRAFAQVRERERSQIGAPTVTRAGFAMATGDNPERKRYFGWRRFFAAAGAFLRRVGGVIINAVRVVVDALKQAAGQAFEILRYLWRKVRVAVRVARLAARRLYCWLTGTPVGTTADGHVVATHWGLDFDTVNYISRDCPPELLTLHGDRLHWMSTSLEFMARLATVVLALCLKAAVSWLLVAYDTFKAVREMLHDEAFRGLFSDDLLERGVI